METRNIINGKLAFVRLDENNNVIEVLESTIVSDDELVKLKNKSNIYRETQNKKNKDKEENKENILNNIKYVLAKLILDYEIENGLIDEPDNYDEFNDVFYKFIKGGEFYINKSPIEYKNILARLEK